MEEKIIYGGVPAGIRDKKLNFCPGCTHMIAYRLIAECLNEMGELDNAIIVRPIGCSLNADRALTIHTVQSMHGRAAATATGVTRVKPDSIVMTYQGDGDAHAIGSAETLHAANRGEKMTVIVINNSIYGMTGGQMSPDTLVGMKTTTGTRDPEIFGYPMDFTKIIGGLGAPGYVARGSLYSPKDIIQSKKYIMNALKCQKELGKYSYVELLSFCPTNWGIKAKDCKKFCEENVLPVFPTGEYKNCFNEQ